jgi:hypothetical protein
MYDLHHNIQVVMGWINLHLYHFNVGKEVIADTRLLDDELGPVTDVKVVMLPQVFFKVGTALKNVYDLGDSWIHYLELVELSTHPIKEVLPLTIRGEHACPTEDCGGTFSYKALEEVSLNPKYPECKSSKRWAGNKFDPMQFGIAKV